MVAWHVQDMPDLTGKTVVVTGASNGIGLQTAAGFAAAGARTVLACRNPAKAADALDQVQRHAPGSDVQVVRLDLADQSQIVQAARETLERFPVVDVLVNNAGVMSPDLARTVDGFESTFGTNHLGHFAFTGLVLPALLASPSARVVTVSSLSHRFGDTTWDPSGPQEGYRMSRSYARSKLANLLFAVELQARLQACGATALSVGAHPGFAKTSIMGSADAPSWSERLLTPLVPTATDAARPSLRAATDPAVRGGEYYGPGAPGGIAGAPVRVKASRKTASIEDRDRLWTLSTRLTGVEYLFPTTASRTG